MRYARHIFVGPSENFGVEVEEGYEGGAKVG